MNTIQSRSRLVPYLIVGYLFLFIFRPYEYWPILAGLYIERIYAIFLIITAFIKRRRGFPVNIVTISIIWFFVAMIFASLAAYVPEDAVKPLEEYGKFMLIWIVILIGVEDIEDLKTVIMGFIVVMFIYISKSLWEYFLYGKGEYRMGILRLIGIDSTMNDPNSFAATLVYSLPFLWALFRYKPKSKHIRKLVLVSGLFTIMAIILTGSRSGMVSTLLMMLLVLMSQKKKFRYLIIILVVLGVSWFFMPEPLRLRFESIFDQSVGEGREWEWAAGSANSRIQGLLTGIRLWSEHPMFGIGPGNFYHFFGLQAHNLYGQLLGEMGTMGALPFFTMVFSLLIKNRSARNRAKAFRESGSVELTHDDDRAVQFVQMIALACNQTILLLLFNGNFGHNLYRYNWLLIAGYSIISWYILKSYEQKYLSPQPGRL